MVCILYLMCTLFQGGWGVLMYILRVPMRDRRVVPKVTFKIRIEQQTTRLVDETDVNNKLYKLLSSFPLTLDPKEQYGTANTCTE